MVFHSSLSDRKFPQVPRTPLSILAFVNNVVVWMVFIHPPTSKFSSPFNNHFVTAPKAQITIGITVSFMFHSFFQFPSKIEVLQFYSMVSWDSIWEVAEMAKSTIWQVLFFIDFFFIDFH